MRLTPRIVAGALILDVPRLAACLCRRGGWVGMRNRHDRLSRAPSGRGVSCDWNHTRSLHVVDVFPLAGAWLWGRAFGEFPLRLAESPAETERPDVSFLIGHRGTDRWPALRRVLGSIAAQRGVAIEAVVVEQDSRPRIREHVPRWVRYAFDPVPDHMAFNRARGFNRAAAVARGRVLILHDSDLLVPMDYAAEHFKRHEAGFEVANLKRFIFYLARGQADQLNGPDASFEGSRPRVEMVLENATGGGSLSIGRRVYGELGGMDEAFEGWGGEDVEFWGRARTRRLDPFGYMPLGHIWHPPAPKKATGDRNNALMAERCVRPIAGRIAALRQSNAQWVCAMSGSGEGGARP